MITHLKIQLLENLKDEFRLLSNNLEYTQFKGDKALGVIKLKNTAIENLFEAFSPNIRIYKQHANQEHTIHTDVGGISSALNFMITNSNEPVIFYKDNQIFKFHYTCALLDVTIPHSVPKSKKDRIFLRMAFKQNYNIVRDYLSEYIIK